MNGNQGRPEEPDDSSRLVTVQADAGVDSAVTVEPPRRGFGGMFRSLSNRDLRLIILAGFGSMYSFQMQAVAFSYMAFQITGKATALGAVNLATGLSQTLALLFAGAMIDRLPRRRTLVTTQLLLGSVAVLNFLLVLAGIVTVEQFVLVSFLQGSIFALNGPSRQAFLSAVSRSPEELHNSIALQLAGQNLTRVIGPTIAGLTLSLPVIGAPAAFFVVTTGYVWSLVCILRVRNRGESLPRKKTAFHQDLVEGWRYIVRTPILLSLLWLMMGATLLGTPHLILMAVFAERVFEVGAAGLGLLLSVTGFGALGGALLIAYLSDSPNKGRIQLAVGLVYALGIGGFALAPNLWLALPFLILAGAGGSMFLSVNSGLLMSHASPGMTGRIAAAQSLSFSLSPLGVFPASALADAIGPRATIAGSAFLLAVVIIGLSLFMPALRRLR